MDARYELINVARVWEISKTQLWMPFMDLSISRDMVFDQRPQRRYGCYQYNDTEVSAPQTSSSHHQSHGYL